MKNEHIYAEKGEIIGYGYWSWGQSFHQSMIRAVAFTAEESFNGVSFFH